MFEETYKLWLSVFNSHEVKWQKHPYVPITLIIFYTTTRLLWIWICLHRCWSPERCSIIIKVISYDLLMLCYDLLNNTRNNIHTMRLLRVEVQFVSGKVYQQPVDVRSFPLGTAWPASRWCVNEIFFSTA